MRRSEYKPGPPDMAEETALELIGIMDMVQEIVQPLQSQLENVYQIISRYEEADKRAAWASLFVDEAKGDVVSVFENLQRAIEYLTRPDDRYMRRPA